MIEALDKLKEEALREMGSIADNAALESFRLKYLGKKGALTHYLRNLSEVPPEMRPVVGKKVNDLKVEIEGALTEFSKKLSQKVLGSDLKKESVDITLPGRFIAPGHRNPLIATLEEMEDIFLGLGFSIYEGSEIETEYFNFEALNMPADHPARDMQDTFYLLDGRLLRTHTSPVQIHVMKSTKPPIAMIAPGAVYRRDADVSHSPMFHQIEGLMVDKAITMGHLKGVLTEMLHQLFGDKIGVRFRPSFFPFTEPSAEVDIECVICSGKGCRVCKQSGWVEILGSGMVDPAVYRAVGYDPRKYSGFAFGIGIERVTMLKYGINDIRLFFESDLKFLRQF